MNTQYGRIAAERVTDGGRAIFENDYVREHITLVYAGTVKLPHGITVGSAERYGVCWSILSENVRPRPGPRMRTTSRSISPISARPTMQAAGPLSVLQDPAQVVRGGVLVALAQVMDDGAVDEGAVFRVGTVWPAR